MYVSLLEIVKGGIESFFGVENPEGVPRIDWWRSVAHATPQQRQLDTLQDGATGGFHWLKPSSRLTPAVPLKRHPLVYDNLSKATDNESLLS